MTDVLRYGKLYSTNELAILFAGAADAASSLDSKINQINGILNNRYGLKIPVPITKDSLTNIMSEMVSGRELRIYKATLNDSMPNGSRVLEAVQSELEGYARKQSLDCRDRFPILIEADSSVEAEEMLEAARERISNFKGIFELRGAEMQEYLSAINYIGSGHPGKYIFSRTNGIIGQ